MYVFGFVDMGRGGRRREGGGGARRTWMKRTKASVSHEAAGYRCVARAPHPPCFLTTTTLSGCGLHSFPRVFPCVLAILGYRSDRKATSRGSLEAHLLRRIHSPLGRHYGLGWFGIGFRSSLMLRRQRNVMPSENLSSSCATPVICSDRAGKREQDYGPHAATNMDIAAT